MGFSVSLPSKTDPSPPRPHFLLQGEGLGEITRETTALLRSAPEEGLSFEGLHEPFVPESVAGTDLEILLQFSGLGLRLHGDVGDEGPGAEGSGGGDDALMRNVSPCGVRKATVVRYRPGWHPALQQGSSRSYMS